MYCRCYRIILRLLTCLCQVIEKGKKLPVLKATIQISSNLSKVMHMQTLIIIITLYVFLRGIKYLI